MPEDQTIPVPGGRLRVTFEPDEQPEVEIEYRIHDREAGGPTAFRRVNLHKVGSYLNVWTYGDRSRLCLYRLPPGSIPTYRELED